MEPATRRLEELRKELGAVLRPPVPRRATAGPKRRKARARLSARDVAFLLVKGIVIIALPFVLYVRAAVELYSRGAPSWLAVLVSMLLTLGLALLYAVWLSRRFAGNARWISAARWVAVPIVAAWCGYSLLYLARTNAKSDDVRAHYTSLHPVLRVALSTFILFDSDLVVTDMRRQPADYARMGLPVNDRTRHFEQNDGWVHAVDLRTIGRGELQNRAVQLYFWSMGFSTLRHVGTADHLHVQLRTSRNKD